MAATRCAIFAGRLGELAFMYISGSCHQRGRRPSIFYGTRSNAYHNTYARDDPSYREELVFNLSVQPGPVGAAGYTLGIHETTRAEQVYMLRANTKCMGVAATG